MPAVAYFQQIKETIIQTLKKSLQEIYVAVAWLTDEDLITVMTYLQKDGKAVTLIISNSKENFAHVRKFKPFLAAGGRLFICDAIFMHHKFCLIDNDWLINGSYNWSYTACNSEENIIVYHANHSLDTDKKLFLQFRSRFQMLINKHSFEISDYRQLKDHAYPDLNQIVSADDIRLGQLREEFEKAVKISIDTAKAIRIPLDYDGLIRRMANDGGGVYFVKRIMRDEISASDMKSGFKKLEAQIPNRVDLSFEYLVCIPKFRELFTAAELDFCINLMRKYDLFKD